MFLVGQYSASFSTRIKRLMLQQLHVNAYALIGANLLTAVGSYLFWVVVARRFRQEIVGISSAAFASIAIIGLLSDLGLGSGLVRFLPMKGKREGDSLIRAALWMRIGASTVVVLVFILGLAWWSPGLLPLHSRPELWLIFASIAVLNGIFQIQNSVSTAMRDTRYALFATTILTTAKFVSVISWSLGSDLVTVLLSVDIALAVTVLIQVLFFLPRVRPGYRPEKGFKAADLGQFYSYSASNLIADLSLDLPPLLVPILIVNSLGAEANAHFHPAWMTANLLRTACRSIGQSVFAEGSTRIQDLYSSLRQGVWLSLVVVVFSGLGLLLVGPQLLMLFGKGYSEQGAPFLPWLLFSVIPFSIVNLFVTAQRVHSAGSGDIFGNR